jgi:O-antigen/teichoic acid export membrane protein
VNLISAQKSSSVLNSLTNLFRIPLYINAIYLIANTAVTSLLGFFFWMVVARFYTEVELGFSSAVLSVINFLTILSLAGLNVTLVRFLHHADKPQQLINTCFTLSGVISLLIAGIFVVGLDVWSPAISFIGENAFFTTAFISFTLLSTLSRLMDTTFIAARKAEFTLFKNIIFSLLKIPLPILFVLFFHTFGIVASWGTATGVALVVSLIVFLPRVQNKYRPVPTIRLSLIKNIGQYSGGNYLATLLASFPVFLLPLMVVNVLGAESNAHFYVAWMMAGIIFAIPTAISLSLLAEGSHSEESLRENVIRSAKFALLLLVPVVILLILVGKWLLLAFGQSYSANALSLLRILAISSLPYGINSIYMSVLRATNRIKAQIIIQGLIAMIAVLVSYLIIPETGIIGVGYAWLGAQGVVAIYVILIPKLGLHQ